MTFKLLASNTLANFCISFDLRCSRVYISNMIKFISLCVLVFTMVGCAGAEIVKITTDPKGGTVKYKNGSISRDESRTMALNSITDFCGGTYKIMSEEFATEIKGYSVTNSYSGSTVTPQQAKYAYINFICEKY